MGAVPKRRISKGRKKRRRIKDVVEKQKLSTCPSCNSVKRQHEACPNCGKYKEEQVIATN